MPRNTVRAPHKLTLRTYNVGFGDCFLLTFHYKSFDRRILIDFGTSSPPRNADDNHMLQVAEDIREQCRGANGEAKLHAVVATHRHLDHISGFSTEGDGPGKIIASLEPDLVVQPWTEDPNAQPDAESAASASYTGGRPDAKAFVSSLRSMHAIAEAVTQQCDLGIAGLGIRSTEHLRFLGETNLSNKSAVANLMDMGRKGRATYVSCGSKSGLEKLLPGVGVQVLGPPTLKQSQSIRKQRSRDSNEFWHFHSFWQFQQAAAANSGDLLFPDAAVEEEAMPPSVRWFVARAQRIRGDQMLELVRELDKAMNNTSVILLFQAGGTKLLFPGDAQIENWSYALSQPEICEMLTDVNIYKVGHHGSLNATPKTLWGLFERRSEQEGPGRLQSILSTKPGKHGNPQSNTEVPRRTLVAALERESDVVSTHALPKAQLGWDLEVEL